MRGRQAPQASMLAFVDLETRIPLDHPLRTIKSLADEALADLSPLFDASRHRCERTARRWQRKPLMWKGLLRAVTARVVAGVRPRRR